MFFFPNEKICYLKDVILKCLNDLFRFGQSWSIRKQPMPPGSFQTGVVNAKARSQSSPQFFHLPQTVPSGRVYGRSQSGIHHVS